MIWELKGRVGRLSTLIGLRSHVLFGSVARGSALRESDVDVLVVAEGLPGLTVLRARVHRPPQLYGQPRAGALVLHARGGLEGSAGPASPGTCQRVPAMSVVERPRIDVMDALEYGVVVFYDGFWEGLRRAYMQRRPKRPPTGASAWTRRLPGRLARVYVLDRVASYIVVDTPSSARWVG